MDMAVFFLTIIALIHSALAWKSSPNGYCTLCAPSLSSESDSELDSSKSDPLNKKCLSSQEELLAPYSNSCLVRHRFLLQTISCSMPVLVVRSNFAF